MEKQHHSMGLWDTKSMFHCSMLIFFVVGLSTLFIYGNNNLTATTSSASTYTKTQAFERHKIMKTEPQPPSSFVDSCDLFSGRWVHDNKSYYPLYKEHECPYIQPDMACQTYGRKDSKYQQWRWQPHGCDFPRFDGKTIVEKLKGRRILFVGDSLNRNQWNSMICMLHSSIPGKKMLGSGLNGTLLTFSATDYNISIDFYWAPMIVVSNGDNATNHHLRYRIVQVQAIEKHARHWVDADVLVFNSYHWWRNVVVRLLLRENTGLLSGGPNQTYEEVDSHRAYKMALDTWSKWAHTNIDPLKTKLFFMGATSTHFTALEWGGTGTCYGETEPVMDDGYYGSDRDTQMLSILESTMHNLQAKGVNVAIINITQLTQSRKDGHTTIYKKEWSRPLIELQQKNPELASDCLHWCLPGVPDIWNELLLAYIFKESKPASK